MDIVIKMRDMIALSPNERYTVPDEIGQQLIDRGKAEEIKPELVEQEKKHAKRGK